MAVLKIKSVPQKYADLLAYQQLPDYIKNGRTWRIPKDALKEYIKEQARLR